ncbi:unnamed protein product [Clonostachys rhizophaga]|uniref:Amino-acid transporter arg-13 n=3 Tax=Clonostachys TaxID=110564 RepID=A0A9N9YPD7_9HYPO|nr:unnamed protein product [Clonostachys rhizophaga]
METSQLAIEPVQAPAEMSLKPQAAAMEAIEDVTYGSIAGIVGKYIEYPFDTVKVRLQSQPDHLPLRYTGPLDCFRQSLKADGIRGLYRGITAPLVGAAAENSCLFMFESVGREAMFSIGWASRRDGLSLPQLYLTGAFAGAFASLALTPIELVKCKIQAPAGGAPALRPVAVIRSIFRHGGIMGFWHGQMGTLIRETGGSAAWFGAKETTTALFREQRLKSVTSQAEREALATTPLPFWQQAIAGASAGIAYNFLFFPADTIKSRMQTMPLGGSHVKRTFWSEGVAVWKQHGLKGMYRGCGITCLRSAPSSAFIFMVYDGLKRHLPMH